MIIRRLSPDDLAQYRQLRLFSIGESPASLAASHQTAKALYRRLGFQLAGVDARSLCIDGVYHDEERMQLSLDAGNPDQETV